MAKSPIPSRIAANIAVFDFTSSADEMRRLHALARPDGRVVVAAHAPVWDEAV